MLKMHSEQFERELRAFEEELYQRFKGHFDLNVLVFRRLSDIIAEKDRVVELKSDFQRTINFLFCRSCRLHWSVLILCQKGFGPEAGILLRSLMEQVVNMAWIGKENPDQRAKLFVDYDRVAKKMLYDNYDLHGVFPDLTNTQRELMESREEVERAYQEVKGNYKQDQYWAPKSIRSRAHEVGLKYDWNFYYWYYSFIAHSNAASQFEFVRPLAEKNLFVVGPSDSMIRDVLHLNNKYVLLALDLWNKVFELELDGLVHELSDRLGKVSFSRLDEQRNSGE